MAIRAIGDQDRGQDQGATDYPRSIWRANADLTRKGFDEFMNLVIDDAVEVKLANKTDEEKRRELGRHRLLTQNPHTQLTNFKVRYCSKEIMSRLYKHYNSRNVPIQDIPQVWRPEFVAGKTRWTLNLCFRDATRPYQPLSTALSPTTNASTRQSDAPSGTPCLSGRNCSSRASPTASHMVS